MSMIFNSGAPFRHIGEWGGGQLHPPPKVSIASHKVGLTSMPRILQARPKFGQNNSYTNNLCYHQDLKHGKNHSMFLYLKLFVKFGLPSLNSCYIFSGAVVSLDML